MLSISMLQPVDYLIIGHITKDLTSKGPRMGGTATYAGLTAHNLGFSVGVVTSWGAELPLEQMRDIPIANFPSEQSTTFENISTKKGRIQKIHYVAPRLDYFMIPEPWRNAPIVHLAPVAQEVEPALVRNFPDSSIFVTPQGWLRRWNSDGLVSVAEWPEAAFVLQQSNAAIISAEDVGEDETKIEELASSCHVMAITEGSAGVRLFWNGDVRRFHSPSVKVADPVGAGDIFAASFFCRLFQTHDPWEATRFATRLASISVTRPGLAGIPTQEEIQASLVEVL